MKDYLFSLLGASLCIALISLLSPNGSSAKYVRLLSALFLICVLISPMHGLIDGIRDLANGELRLPEWGDTDSSDAEQELQSTLDNASKSYFLQSLTQMLEREFSISPGELRCSAVWTAVAGDQIKPSRIHVLLSGSAIWKDPKKIELFINELLGCECIVAVS